MELNEVDLQALARPNALMFYFSCQNDVFDNSQSKSSQASAKTPFQKYPLNTKFFYLKPTDKVKDLFIAIVRKIILFFDFEPKQTLKTKLTKANAREKSEYAWSVLSRSKGEDLFFQALYNGLDLFPHLDHNLNSVFQGQSNSFKLELIFRTAKIDGPDFFKPYLLVDKEEGIYKTVSPLNLNNFQSKMTLSDLFQLNYSPETLDNQNLWLCNKCNKNVAAIKTLQIYRAPPHLIVQLKKLKSRCLIPNIIIDFELDIKKIALSPLTPEDYNVEPNEFTKENVTKIQELFKLPARVP